MQQAAGIEDTPEQAYHDFMTWGEDAEADWVRYYVDKSKTKIYDWLIDLGVRFQGV